MPTNIIMPQMGESVVEGTVSRWIKQEGDRVDEFEPLLEVETDKVTSEIPSPASGVLLKIHVPEGQTVAAGTLLAVIGQAGESVPDAPGRGVQLKAPADAPANAPERAPAHAQAVEEPSGNGGGRPHVTPVVARIAAEHGVDVAHVRGTGREGRVTKKDILAYIENPQPAAAPTTPEEDLAPWERPGSGDLFKPTDDLYKAKPAEPKAAPAPREDAGRGVQLNVPKQREISPANGDEVIPHSAMRRRIAEHMVRSKLHTAPHVTTVFEADMSAATAHRAAHKADFAARGVNLTFTAYFVAAAARALRQHPMVNGQWSDEGIRLKREINIGVAAALDDGLIVPVVRRADELSLAGIARQVNDLANRARAGSLAPDEVSGGTFTITNHGVSGSLFATPIINQPQTAILGVGMIQKRVVVLDGDAIAVRPMVYLSLTFDHRVLDGAAADHFMADLVRLLESAGE